MLEPVVLTSVTETGVARITLNRPTVHNAVNEQVINEFCETIGRLNSDRSLRCIVITGAGPSFSSGTDVFEMRESAAYSKTRNRDESRRFGHMLKSIYDSQKPVIALVNGPAIGAALGIIGACDIAIGVEDAYFKLPEPKLGIAPAVTMPFIVRMMGMRNATRYILSGEQFDAREATTLGVLHLVSTRHEMEFDLKKYVDRLIANSPVAACECKEILRRITGRPIDDDMITKAADYLAQSRVSKEGQEGLSAFIEGRKPDWLD